MAQYWDDFSGQTPEQFPDGWEIPVNVDQTQSATALIREDALASNGITCRLPGSQSRKGIVKTEIGSVSASVDVRIRMRRNSGLTEITQAGCLIRASDVASGTNFVVFFTGGVGIRVARGTTGGTTVLATADTVPGWAVDAAWRKVRATLAPNGDYQVFAWADTAEEPTTPILTGNATSLAESGRVGLWWFHQSPQCHCDWIGVGTAGDPAPTGPIQQGPAVPTSLTVTSITTTSATLGWSGSAPNYDMEWRPVAGSTTAVNGLSTNSYNLTGLSPATSYEFRVRAVDGAQQSDWSAWVGFDTLGGAQTVTVGDSGQAADTLSASQSVLSVADTGQSLDAIHGLAALLALQDLAGGADTAIINTGDSGITLHADQDRENWDIPNCTVIGNSIHLQVRRQFNAYNPGVALWFNALGRVSGVQGLTPQFTLDMGANISSVLTLDAIHPMWSVDGQSWNYFDNRAFNEFTMLASFSNNAPFASDVIHLCVSPPVRVGDCTAWVNALAAAYPQWVTQPPSALAYAQAPFVVAHSVPQTDDSGRVIPALPIHGLRIADDTQTPDGVRRTLVWCAGVHSGEDYGDWTMRGAVEFALSSDPIAVRLRRNYQIFVYPLVTPCGRYGGDWRGNWEFGVGQVSPDPNRDWHDSTMTHIQRLVSAILMDTGGVPHVHGYYDFHGQLNSVQHSFFGDSRGHTSEFLAAVGQFLPQGITVSSIASHPRASQAFFAYYLNAYFSMTGEPNQFLGPALDVAKVKQIGVGVAKAFDFIYPQIYTDHRPLMMDSGRGYAYPLPQGQAGEWAYSVEVSISGAGLPETVEDGLVCLTEQVVPSEVWTHCNADGSDLRVMRGATPCARHLEHIDVAGQALRLWVKVGQVPTTGATIRLFFGRPLGAETNTPGFWDVACYTMDDGATGTLTDISGNGHHAELSAAQTSVQGVLGQATLWPGNAGGSTGIIPDNTFKTCFGFFRFANVDPGQQLCGANDGNNRRFFIGRNGSKINSGWGNASTAGTIDLTPDQWHLLAFSVNPSTVVERTVDGLADGSSLASFSGTSTAAFHHGRLSNGVTPLTGASVDHLVISKQYRTRAWLRLYYLSIVTPGTLFSVGAVQDESTGSGPRWLIAADAGTGAEESPAASIAALVADLAAAADAPGVAVGIFLADQGAGLDAPPSGAAQVPVLEVATAGDAVGQILAALSLGEFAQGVDAAWLGLSLSVADAGGGTDALVLFTEAVRQIADAATGGEVLGVTVAPVAVADVATGADVPVLAVRVDVSDAATGLDELALSLLKQILDAGQGLDHVVDIEFAIVINVVDSGSGLDLLGPVSAIASVLEQARGIEATIVAGNEPPRNATILFRGRTANIHFTGRHARVTFHKGD
ncbi:fibronectin type III domain-containing protein [Geoalkalibacter sp.]|uniref:fibronectin type III domain-containing protein n=1 Tax=Geoalkalibacter sp. TaxID=3041440 RepID=UPI00272E62F3|nr:fibronectin type III domain-containing protein [Geoalkalibacter sp.]